MHVRSWLLFFTKRFLRPRLFKLGRETTLGGREYKMVDQATEGLHLLACSDGDRSKAAPSEERKQTTLAAVIVAHSLPASNPTALYIDRQTFRDGGWSAPASINLY